MRRTLQSEGRSLDPLERSCNRHRLGRGNAVLVSQGRGRAAARGAQEPSSLWASLMRILLTGTSGQVGGALRPLLDKGGTVIAPSRSAFDLSKPEMLAGALDGLKPDLIVNPAAYTA